MSHSVKQTFLDRFEEEHATTVRVLGAYPADKLEFKPHDRSMSAKDLAWLFPMEQELSLQALTTGFDWSVPQLERPKAPDDIGTIIAAFDAGHARLMEVIRGLDDAAFDETIQFFTAPKTLGDMTKEKFLWFMLFDQIHHRGQLSVYLRMAGGKVPSIYGPSADEPWF